MASYTVIRSCGHEEVVYLFGNTKERERRLEHSEPFKLCRSCAEKELIAQRERENQEAAEAAKQMQLPPLTGSTKQVPWSETLRQKMLADIDKINHKYLKADNRNNPKLLLAIDFIRSKTEARWWIDHRDLSDYELMELVAAEYEEAKVASIQPPEEVITESLAEATVRPENPITETVAEITAKKDSIEISFPEKRDDFRTLMRKTLKMEWDGKWKRELSPWNGTPEDRAAEAGHRLLSKGYIIRIFDEKIRMKAIAGEYERECSNWILALVEGKHKGWLSIRWNKNNDDYYKVARRLPGSQYRKPTVIVRPEHYEEVLDFAQMYGFKFGEKALALIENAKKTKMDSLIATVDDPEPKERVTALCLPPVLEIPTDLEVDDEFRDY